MNYRSELINDTRLPAHFWRNVYINLDTGCWCWRTGPDVNGYGRTSLNGRRGLAHRVAYTALVGPVPPHLDLDHLCRVRHCVNPGHLEPVTRRENTLRGRAGRVNAELAAQRTHCGNGHERNDKNTRYAADGRRYCRACEREWRQRRRAQVRWA